MVFLASLHFFITCVMTDFNAHGQYIITFHYELTILMNHVTRGISRRDIAHGYDFIRGKHGCSPQKNNKSSLLAGSYIIIGVQSVSSRNYDMARIRWP